MADLGLLDLQGRLAGRIVGDRCRHGCGQRAPFMIGRGLLWEDHGLGFASQAVTPLDVSHVRRAFKAITRKAGLGENWTPRELRHTFVSLM